MIRSRSETASTVPPPRKVRRGAAEKYLSGSFGWNFVYDVSYWRAIERPRAVPAYPLVYWVVFWSTNNKLGKDYNSE